MTHPYLAKITLVYLLFAILIISCTTSSKVKDTNNDKALKWEELVDKDLSKWDKYLSYKHKEGYNGDVPKDDKGEEIAPIGLNKKGYDVFTTLKDGDNTLIKISGEYYGCIATKKEYKNYRLQLKFKWGEEKLQPREKLLKDSGILYHSVGPHGAEHWRSWMMSQEFQIMEGHTGDYWSQASSAIDIRAYTPEFIMNPMANETQDYLHIGEGGPYKMYCLRSNNYENPHGEWNTLDLVCFEDKSLHIVNGKVVMILRNSRYLNTNEEFVPLTEGKIQIQSEAAEIYFKDIKITTLDSLAPQYSKYF